MAALHRKFNFSTWGGTIAAIAIITVGVVLFLAHAAGFFASTEAESGILQGNAATITDTSASNSSAVMFRSSVISLFDKPFAATSPWNSPIAASVQLDADSASIISAINSNITNPAVANVYEFGIPFYKASSATGTYTVTCTKPWGTCDFSGKQIPLSSAMKPHTGSDGAMVVIDETKKIDYEFWQYAFNNGAPTTSWGVISDITANGTDDGVTGAGISRAAGIVRLSDIQRGRIDHALVFSSSLCKNTTFRYPAWKTDGKAGTASNLIEEGSRIQLDPSINVDTISGITPIEKMVARALQTYGAYNMDCGGARMAYSFELDPTATSSNAIGSIYLNAGLRWDYDNMPHIPWTQLRVLKSWNGQ